MLVPKSAAQMVAATIRTVFVQPDAATAREHWQRVSDSFRSRFPKLSDLLDEAEEDVLADLAFPAEHWKQIWSNNPLERLNREIKHSTFLAIYTILLTDPSPSSSIPLALPLANG